MKTQGTNVCNVRNGAKIDSFLHFLSKSQLFAEANAPVSLVWCIIRFLYTRLYEIVHLHKVFKGTLDPASTLYGVYCGRQIQWINIPGGHTNGKHHQVGCRDHIFSKKTINRFTLILSSMMYM